MLRHVVEDCFGGAEQASKSGPNHVEVVSEGPNRCRSRHVALTLQHRTYWAQRSDERLKKSQESNEKEAGALSSMGMSLLTDGIYRLGLAHFATFETLVFRFQALLQIQRLLLIPTYFALSPASKQSNV